MRCSSERPLLVKVHLYSQPWQSLDVYLPFVPQSRPSAREQDVLEAVAAGDDAHVRKRHPVPDQRNVRQECADEVKVGDEQDAPDRLDDRDYQA